MFLLRSIIESGWGSFIAHIGLGGPDNLFSRTMLDVQLGVDTGIYAVTSIEAAGDVLMGAKIAAIRRLIATGGSATYVMSVASLVLRSFGVSPAKADKSVRKAFDRLKVEAPGRISWWRPVA